MMPTGRDAIHGKEGQFATLSGVARNWFLPRQEAAKQLSVIPAQSVKNVFTLLISGCQEVLSLQLGE